MNHHMVAGAEGARHHVVRGGRRPPLIMWSAIVFFVSGLFSFHGFGPLILLALATSCFMGFGHFLWLWPRVILLVLAPVILLALATSCFMGFGPFVY